MGRHQSAVRAPVISTDHRGGASDRGAPLFVAIGLCAAVFAVYAPVFDNGFWHDDYILLIRAASAANVHDVLWSRWVDMKYNRPLWQLGLFAEYRAFGLHAGWYLLVNVLLHAANTLLLWRVLRGQLGRAPAALGAAFFAIGLGYYGKAVIWVANLCELAGTAFVLATALALERSLRSRRREAWMIGATLLYVLALSAKESTVVAPVLAAAVLALNGATVRQIAVRLSPLAAVCLAYFAYQIATASGIAGAPRGLQVVPQLVRSAAELLTFMVVPAQVGSPLVQPDWPVVALTVSAVHAVRPVLTIALAISACVWFMRGPALVRWALAVLAAFLLPFGFVEFPRGWFEIRYAYLPATVFCAIVASLVCCGVRHRARRVRVPLLVATLCLVGGTVWLTRAFEAKFDGMSRNAESLAFLQELQDVIQAADR